MTGKTEISWSELVKTMKKETPDLSLTDILKSAGKEWKQIKAGTHSKYAQGKSAPVTRKKKSKIKPGHKGAPSKTRPGKIDFRTHKGDKYYHRDGHLEDENREGVKGKPYSHHKTRKHHHKSSSGKHHKIIKQLEKIIDELKKE